MSTKICRDCGKEFDPVAKRTICKAGFVNQCAHCSRKTGDADTKYLGKQGLTNKDGSITIFRENLAWVKGVIKGENARGFTANLSLGSPVNQSAKKEEM